MQPPIAVIIPTFNNRARLRTALDHWRRVQYEPFTVIVVNDGCSDGTGEMLRTEYPEVVQLSGDGNLWFAGSCNLGLRYALDHGFAFATVFNDDNYPPPEILTRQVECAGRHPGAMLGVKSYKLGSNKVIWGVGGFITRRIIGKGITWVGKNEEDTKGLFEKEFEVDFLDGSGQFYPADLIRGNGFWDERYQTYYADLEYAYRAKRKGYTLISNPAAVVWHDYTESPVVMRNIGRYRFKLLYLLFNRKSTYCVYNMFRFWFTYFPFSAPLTILRVYAVMVRKIYLDPAQAGKRTDRQ
ncbi:MAG TPA: glycosyltransferase family 2 protein [Bacteroidota bacterium]|nr:glycosyltransferase family 2 protein [Bacteroidota bacterium]